MSNRATLEKYNREIVEFQEKVNAVLAFTDRLEYDTAIYSGTTNNIDTLFLSINPGYAWDEWENRKAIIDKAELDPGQIKFLPNTATGETFPLAAAILEVIFGGDESKLLECGETYFQSFFATPNDAELGRQLRLLPTELIREHEDIMARYRNFVLREIKPRRIICIGVKVFDAVSSILKIEPEQTLKSSSGRYFIKSVYDGIPIYGLIHLTGARVSNENWGWLKQYFANNSQEGFKFP